MAGNFAAGNLSRSRLFAFSSHDFKSPLHRVTRSNDETQGKGRWNDANIFSIIPGVSARRNSSSSSSSSHHLSRSPFSYSVRFETNPPPPPHMPRCQRISSFVSLVPIQPETESPVPGYF